MFLDLMIGRLANAPMLAKITMIRTGDILKIIENVSQCG